jgi:ATP-binding cassette subfamily C protein CydCD
VEHVLLLGPAATRDPGGLAALITRGIDALDGYYARYLPQLVLAVIVPIAVLLTVLGQDLLTTVIIAVTLPLIPVFMILIGLYTRSRVDRQWRTLGTLAGHFLDLVSGLPTLIAFGRAKAQAAAIREIGDRYRGATMGVLRVSFLSSLALELLATLSVALVAVSVGLRLAEGQIQYSVALFVLILAPEAYLPLRLVGQHYHAAAEGLGAAERLFEVLETPVPSGGTSPVPAGPLTIEVTGLVLQYPGAPPLDPTTFSAEPGTITALVGTSGGGKSTLLAALLGFLAPASGGVVVSGASGAVALDQADLAQWRRRAAWLPQRARLVSQDLAEEPRLGDVVRLGRPDATDAQVWSALERAGVAQEVRALPGGLAAALRADGSGLSVGQQQRVALARCLLGDPDVLLLDEPTAALDPRSEAAVIEAIRGEAARGATVIVVAHRPALVAIADQVVRVGGPPAERVTVPVERAPIVGAGW